MYVIIGGAFHTHPSGLFCSLAAFQHSYGQGSQKRSAS